MVHFKNKLASKNYFSYYAHAHHTTSEINSSSIYKVIVLLFNSIEILQKFFKFFIFKN